MEKDIYIFELAYISGKRFKYVGNCLHMWEIVCVCVVCGKMNWICGKSLKHVGNGLCIWENV